MKNTDSFSHELTFGQKVDLGRCGISDRRPTAAGVRTQPFAFAGMDWNEALEWSFRFQQVPQPHMHR